MVKSMTGFGRCETEINGRAITVEIKSVNHRYFEFSCRITRGYSFLEDKLKAFVNARVARGKIDMFVSVGAADDVPCEVAVNHSLVSGYLAAMKEISDTLQIPLTHWGYTGGFALFDSEDGVKGTKLIDGMKEAYGL